MPRSSPRRDASATFAPAAGERAGGGGADAAAGAGDERGAALDGGHEPPSVAVVGRLGGGTSSDGLRSKKPTGLSWKPIVATGITGQSSGRGT